MVERSGTQHNQPNVGQGRGKTTVPRLGQRPDCGAGLRPFPDLLVFAQSDCRGTVRSPAYDGTASSPHAESGLLQLAAKLTTRAVFEEAGQYLVSHGKGCRYGLLKLAGKNDKKLLELRRALTKSPFC